MTVLYNKKTNKYEVRCYYKDILGNTKQKTKRGFTSERAARKWEKEFKMQTDLDLTMPFEKFVEVYFKDIKPRLKLSTWNNKREIFNTKILPYFKGKSLMDIKTTDIIRWQNHLMNSKNKNGKKYAPTYLRTINNQLNAMFNHAERYYDLQRNPAKKAGNMGKSKANAMQIWTTEEYRRFLECVANKPISFYAFEILYWTGIREGEMLALTMEDFDFETNTLRINKNLYRHGGEVYITDPKTDKSIRNIKIPQFLADEMKEYFKSFYHLKPTDRIFSISKNYLYYEMKRGSKASGVKRIRIHDLRHSHCSLLIQKGYTVVAIADRLGHESIEITYMYAHLFPSVQSEMANDLNNEKELMYHVS